METLSLQNRRSETHLEESLNAESIFFGNSSATYPMLILATLEGVHPWKHLGMVHSVSIRLLKLGQELKNTGTVLRRRPYCWPKLGWPEPLLISAEQLTGLAQRPMNFQVTIQDGEVTFSNEYGLVALMPRTIGDVALHSRN